MDSAHTRPPIHAATRGEGGGWEEWWKDRPYATHTNPTVAARHLRRTRQRTETRPPLHGLHC
eukprot:4033265-Prorocentrum_lima.AAC.1